MHGNGRKPRRLSAAQAAEPAVKPVEGEQDAVLLPAAEGIMSPLGFPLLPVVIGYGFLFYVAVAMLASMATFHEEQVMVVGGKIYLGAVCLSILFTFGAWAAETAVKRSLPPGSDNEEAPADTPSVSN
jgi:hypothetical protein